MPRIPKRNPRQPKKYVTRLIKKIKKAHKTYGRKKFRPIAGAMGAFIPQRISTILKYSQRYTTTSTAGVMAEIILNLNSIYSPINGGGGHQPLGHDQLYTLYNRYRVDSTTVIVRFHKSSASVVGVVGLFAKNDNASVAASGLSALVEQPYFKYKTTAYDLGASMPVVLKRKFDLKTVTGVSQTKYTTDDSYQAVMGTNPTEVICALVTLVDLAEASTIAGFFEIELLYNVTLYDPKNVAQS